MKKTLVLADDLTGALDTAVHFSKGEKGCGALIYSSLECLPGNETNDVLVIDTETRHLEAQAAYKIVYEIVQWAVDHKFEMIMKKTDSALRGNIGTELSALLDAAKSGPVHFIPAFPAMKRTTKNGVHYIDGVKVSESSFGKDVLNPVVSSNVSEIITSGNADAEVHNIVSGESFNSGILVYDAGTDEDIDAILGKIENNDETLLVAGCAGLAYALSKEKEMHFVGECPSPLLIISGSVNPTAIKQCSKLVENGCPRIICKKFNSEKEDEKNSKAVVEIIEALKKRNTVLMDAGDYDDTCKIDKGEADAILHSFGVVAKSVLIEEKDCTLFIIGGDTALAIMDEIGIREIKCVGELMPGVVLSAYKMNGERRMLITKSGGFGDENMFSEIISNTNSLKSNAI